MISDPIKSSFRLFLPSDWIYPEVEEKIREFFKQSGEQFASVVDYLNHTIQSGILPGLKDDGSGQQVYHQGDTRTFAGSLNINQLVEKSLTITFQLKNNYLNWAILYLQLIAYLERRGKSPKPIFLPTIFLHVLDEMGNVIMEFHYKEIQFRQIPSLEFQKQDVGITTTTFNAEFAFNTFEIKVNTDKLSNNTKKEYKY